MKDTKLWIVIPCYNEEKVLPQTAPMFLDEIKLLVEKEKISDESRVLFVDDGSKDTTWKVISELAKSDTHFLGIRQSRNRGHQNALLAGLMEAKSHCDVTISIDCDGQDDIGAMEAMIDEYDKGNEIVYGVRSNRDSDTWFKRTTAQMFYKFISSMGVETIYNHADYRLMSSLVLNHFEDYHEVNLFLRGLVPMIGFNSSTVSYVRKERLAGESHYPLKKMISFAWDGISSMSLKPIAWIMKSGLLFGTIGIIALIIELIRFLIGKVVLPTTILIWFILFISGYVVFCVGLVGEYVGKTYLETKGRPRYIISEKTWEE